MKKYQLKWNNGIELEIVKESDILFDILFYMNAHFILTRIGLQSVSIWMNGQVLA